MRLARTGTLFLSGSMKRIIWVFACVTAFAVAVGFLLFPGTPVLDIRNGQGELLARLVCKNGTFVHRYVHSVHLSDVDEEYSIEADGTLRLTASRFDTLGVGIPFDADGGFSLEGNRFVLRMDRRYRSLPIRVSPLPGHVVITGGREYALSSWVDKEELVILEAKYCPRLLVLFPRRGTRE